MAVTISLGANDSVGNNGVNNKVGIGTTSPSQRLTVAGASNSVGLEVDDTYPRIIFSGNAPVINWTGSNHFYIGETSYTGNVLIRNGGKVGIGTTSPAEKLDVNGNVKAGGGGVINGHLVMGNYHLWVDSQGRLKIKNGIPSADSDGVVVGDQS